MKRNLAILTLPHISLFEHRVSYLRARAFVEYHQDVISLSIHHRVSKIRTIFLFEIE
jgi:hypothetical protein